MINMPLPPCDKILQIILLAYLQLQSPYYFQKVVWSLSFDYFLPRSTLYVPCVTSSFIHLFFSLSLLRIWIWKCCLSKYVVDVLLCRRTISSTFHNRTSCFDVLGLCPPLLCNLTWTADWWIMPNVSRLTWTARTGPFIFFKAFIWPLWGNHITAAL